MKHGRLVLKKLLRTEKGTLMEPLNKYLFETDIDATKIEIKKAVEAFYKVNVADVNTIRLGGKLKKVRYKAGYTPDKKKAIVTLKPGSKIELAA